MAIFYNKLPYKIHQKQKTNQKMTGFIKNTTKN